MDATEAPSKRKSAKQAARDRARRPKDSGEDADGKESDMAVSIAGVSTACSKDALVSSAKAVRKALSTE